MKRIIIIAITILTLSSCNNGKDPLLGFVIESQENNWRKHLKELIDKKKIMPIEYGDFVSYIYDGKDSFKVEYKINKPYPTSKYDIYSDFTLYQNNKLRNIEINLNGDTTCYLGGDWVNNEFIINLNERNKNAIESYGPRKKIEIDKIRKFLIKLYGKPNISSDSLVKEYTIDLVSAELESGLGMFKYLSAESGFQEHISFKDIWTFNNMTVELLRKPFYYDKCFKDTVYPSAHIVYKMNEFDKEMNRIQEDIRKNFRPNDLISIEFKKPIFKELMKSHYNGQEYELFQPINRITRKGPEDKRLGVYDKFNNYKLTTNFHSHKWH
ncbi:MAG: hypothetical protein GY834_06095 [Bacteroidetes bacterium]|nr:hypothetical protein [Bacteroidota bacterium]